MTNLMSTFRHGGIEQWPIGVISGGGGRTPIDGQRTRGPITNDGSCATIITV